MIKTPAVVRSSNGTHKPQLDALRAIAVCSVLVYHFLPIPLGKVYSNDFLPLGELAVIVFFVLSGYLITGILLRYRALTLKDALTRFYTRRALRIFPIYYLALLVWSLIGIQQIRFYLKWNLFYLSNVIPLIHPNALTHLWTLSVEEQFYFLWPFLILLTPYKHLGKMILGAIAFGFLWKVYVAFALGLHWAGEILMPGCLYSLGFGALLSFVEHDETLREYREIFVRIALYSGLVIILLQAVSYMTSRGLRCFWATYYLGASLVFVWLVARAAQGFKGALGKLLEAEILLFMGKISYGIYLYHFFMPTLVHYLADLLGIRQPGTLLRAACASGLAFLLATASWYLIEKPIGRWKNHFTESAESSQIDVKAHC